MSTEGDSSPFCGTPFWDTNLTWNTDTPKFTRCFQNTVLSYTPSIILVLFLPWEIYKYNNSTTSSVPWAFRIISRTVLTGISFAVSMFLFIMFLANRQGDYFTADIVGHFVIMFGHFLSFLLIFIIRRSGQVSSVSQLFYWLAYVICRTLSFTSTLLKREENVGMSESDVVHSIILGLSYINLILQFLPDTPPLYTDLERSCENPPPSERTSYISFFLHSWFDSFVMSGWKKPVNQNDLWDLSYQNSYKGIVQKWEKCLYSNGKENVTVIGPLIKNFGIFFLSGAICQFVYIGLLFTNPQILNLLIAFVQGEEETWKGYLYVAVLTLVSFLIGIFDSWYWNQTRLLSMRIFTALSAIVYKKSLKLSSAGRNKYTTGEVVNLIAVDCSKVQEATMFFNFIFTTPLQISLAIYFLWQYLNYSVLVGFGVVLFFLPFNSFVWHFMEKYNTQQMQFKDERVNLITEILNGIKVLKLYAWEKSFIEKIGEIRHEEINFMKRAQYLEATQFLMWNSAPFLIALSSFTCYVLVDPVNNILDPQTAFVSLTLFNTLKEPLFLLPFGISNMIRGKVSIDRIKDFLNADETDPTSVTHDTMEDAITVGHASFTWNLNDQKDTLRDLSFNVKQGSLVAVVGHVGAGKSSLVSSILGELKKTNGVLNVNGEVAYVSQQAWMRNMTLKENILFSKRYNKVLYDKTIENCALVSDLEMLPAGDTTEIGEKGINLSGGQKQRINLARAVYSKKDIYLFDDPLSAVDAHVGKHIFEKVIGPKGMLQRKTRILVTHGISFLPDTDYILVMKNGRIAEQGSYSQLIKQQGEFSAFILEQLKTAEDSETETDNEAIWKDLEASQGKEFVSKKKIEKAAHRRPKTKSIGSISVLSESDENNPPPSYYSKQTSVADRSSSETVYKTLAGKRGLIEEEHVEVKGVKLEIYIYYMKSGGFLLGIAAFFAYFFFESFQVGNNIWLSVWSDDERAAYDFDVRNMYLIVYGCLGLMQSVFIYTAIMLVTFAAVNASKCLHYDLLKSILKSPMSFFDTTPVGRIVNRFSKDMDEVDVMVPLHFKDCFSQLVIALGAVFVICYSTPITIIAVIPLTAIFLLYTSFYLRTSRQLKRIISINRSPINSHIEETLSGAATIRAYGLEDKFEDENEAKIEDLQKAQYPETISNSWLFLRLQMVGNILIFLTSLITVINRKSVDAGTVGLSLSYVLTCNIDIYMLVRIFADLDKTIVSVERIKEYQEIPQESASKTDRDPSANWPMFGSITFDSYSTRYRPGLDLVLTNINCKIESGEKVGIVGRTGAGKSSITLALFRIIEKVSGRILIDNVDVSEIGLTRLRSALTIIPQDPVIFSGTLRSNLDPFNLYTDRDIWKALEQASLSHVARGFKGGLQEYISEGGMNLSVGQRQLLCMVRALLRNTKILVLDEATAAIDLETDDLIQKTIREEFKHCTVLTIAHRLKTVIDSDKVMVMDKGTIIEYDTPGKLLKNPNSSFYSMCKDAGMI